MGWRTALTVIPWRQWLRRGFLLGLAAGLGGLVPSVHGADLAVAKEYQIKAAFIFNFAHLFKWPDETFTSADTPFQICILGKDPFQVTMDVTVEGENIDGRPVKILRAAEIVEVMQCQIVYISSSEQARLEEILTALRNKPVLTVSDTDNFIEKGGMVKFFDQRNKIRLALYPEAVQESQLHVSAKLLKIAQITRP